MFFIFFGVRSSKLKVREIKENTTCSKCSLKNSYIVFGSASYFHLFWIPFIPLSKDVIFKCRNCEKVVYKDRAPGDLLSALELNPVRRPKWHFLGLLLILAWFVSLSVYGFYKSVEDTVQEQQYEKKENDLNALFEADKASVSYNPSKTNDTISSYLKENIDFSKYGITNSDVSYFSKVKNKKALIVLNIKDSDKLHYVEPSILLREINHLTFKKYKEKIDKYYIGIYDDAKHLIVESPGRIYQANEQVRYNPFNIFYDNDNRDFIGSSREQIDKEKQEFLLKYRDLQTKKATADSTRIAKLFKKIDTKFNFKFNQPAVKMYWTTEINFALKTGMKIPDELKFMLSLHNGKGPFMNQALFMSALNNFTRKFNNKSFADVTNIKYGSNRNKIIPAYYSPYWIPFYEDTSYFYAIDLMPNKKGQVGQIVLFGNDTADNKVVAKDLETFLKLFLNEKIPMDVKRW